jgi:hypothetical protein
MSYLGKWRTELPHFHTYDNTHIWLIHDTGSCISYSADEGFIVVMELEGSSL